MTVDRHRSAVYAAEDQLGRLLAVDADAIAAAARAVFRPDNRVVITYVPAAPAEAA